MRTLTGYAAGRLLPGLLLLALIQGLIGYVFVAGPLVQRSAERLAATLAASAQTGQTPPGVHWAQASAPVGSRSWMPFNRYLARAARKYGAQGQAVYINTDGSSDGGYVLYWSPQRGSVHLAADTVIGARPGLAMLGWLLSTLVLTLLASALLARGLMRPLRSLRDDLAQRIRTLGSSGQPAPLAIAELETLRLDVALLCERLRQALDDRTVLLLGLSHELRGPLARLSLRDSGDADVQADIAEMRDTLEQFLAAADVLGSPGRRLVDPQVLLAELAARYAHNEMLTFVGSPGQPRLLNTVAFARIACNLLDNALRHAPQARVQCHLHIAAGDWTLEIRDDGPGLSAQRKRQPFAAFAPGRSGGLGLGLALSRLLAEQNGWTLSLCATDTQGLCARLSMPMEPA